MEITQVSKNFIKIKGKTANILVIPPVSHPDKLTKTTEADVVLSLDYPFDISTGAIKMLDNSSDISKAEGVRLTISGPGDYEIGGTKISGYKVGNHIVYSAVVDNIELLIGQSHGIESFDKKKESHIIILSVNSELDEKFITSAAPRMVVLYGEKSDDAFKKIATETSSKTLPKVSATLDKLPAEMEVVVLA